MEGTDFAKIAVWLIGFCGTLIVIIGGFAKYVFTKHVEENDKMFDQNREDHRDIREAITRKRTREK